MARRFGMFDNLRTFEMFERSVELKYRLIDKIDRYVNHVHYFRVLDFDEFAISALEIASAMRELGRPCSPAKAIQIFENLHISDAKKIYNTYVKMTDLQNSKIQSEHYEKIESYSYKSGLESFKTTVIRELNTLQFPKVAALLISADRDYFEEEIDELNHLVLLERGKADW